MKASEVPIGIVVLNYNGLTDTVECVDSLLSCDPAPAAITIVDNGSGDGSHEALAERYGGARRTNVLRIETNEGFPGGMNRGIKHFLADDGAKIILLVNNDTVFKPDALGRLATTLERDAGADIATPKILCADGCTIWSTGENVIYPLLLARRNTGKPDGPKFDKPREINSITGCVMAIRKEVFEEIGLFDEAYYAYVEEVDFCKRASDAGFRLVYCPESVVVHKVSGYWGRFGSRCRYLNVRNKAYFLKKNVSPLLWPIATTWYLAVMAVWLLRALGKGRPGDVRAVTRGMADFARGRMGKPDWQHALGG